MLNDGNIFGVLNTWGFWRRKRFRNRRGNPFQRATDEVGSFGISKHGASRQLEYPRKK
jgi:hypothetical protein